MPHDPVLTDRKDGIGVHDHGVRTSVHTVCTEELFAGQPSLSGSPDLQTRADGDILLRRNLDADHRLVGIHPHAHRNLRIRFACDNLDGAPLKIELLSERRAFGERIR